MVVRDFLLGNELDMTFDLGQILVSLCPDAYPICYERLGRLTSGMIVEKFENPRTEKKVMVKRASVSQCEVLELIEL